MSSEKFENLEDDLSSTLDKIRPSVSGLSRDTGGTTKYDGFIEDNGSLRIDQEQGSWVVHLSSLNTGC